MHDPLPANGFYPVSLNLVGRRCVVIGEAGDREAIEKVAALRAVDADVLWIDQPSQLEDTDVENAFFVISTPQDEALSMRLRALADRHKFLYCAIDQPRYGFVAMQAIVSAGIVKIGISTGGVAPRIGKALKQSLEAVLDAKFARFIDCLATQKRRNRSRLRDDAAARRTAMIASAEGFVLETSLRYPAWFEESEKQRKPEIKAKTLRSR